MSSGRHSFACRLYAAALAEAAPVADPPGGGWGQIAEVKRMGLPGMESSVVELTHLDSPDKAKEKMAGFMDAGQITFTCNYYKAGYIALAALFPAGAAGGQSVTNIRWLVRLSDSLFFYCEGFVKSAPIEVPEDGAVTHEVTIEVSGKPTLVNIA